KFWDTYLTETCNISIGYNATANETAKRLPPAYSKNWKFSEKNRKAQLANYKELSIWHDQSMILAYDAMRKFFLHRIIGLVMVGGGVNTYFDLMIRPGLM